MFLFFFFFFLVCFLFGIMCAPRDCGCSSPLPPEIAAPRGTVFPLPALKADHVTRSAASPRPSPG